MAKLFGNKADNQMSPREALTAKFNGARNNLLLVVVFTLINLILLVTNSDRYFLFSAFVPYLIGILAMDMCGKYPSEYYEGGYENYEFFGNGVFAVMLVFAFLGIMLYLISWLFSKKPRVGFLIFALVIFVIDTALMVLFSGISVDMALDYLFHIWVLVSLISGISAYFKLKKLPEEEPAAEVADETVEAVSEEATEEAAEADVESAE